MKNKTTFDPFENLILDKEEQAIEDALERGEFKSNPNLQETKRMLEEAVQQHRQLQVSKPVTLRINQLDLIKIKAKAKRKQIPYQTLLGALIHDFAEGEKDLNLK